MKCADCIFANKSGNENFVYCTYWQEEANKSKMMSDEFVKKVVFPQTSLEKVGLGWGFPKQHYKVETHWSVKGTATEGIMWAEQICVQKDEGCHNFKSTLQNSY